MATPERVTPAVAPPEPRAPQRPEPPAPARPWPGPNVPLRAGTLRRRRVATPLFDDDAEREVPPAEAAPGLPARERDALHRRLLAVADVVSALAAVNTAVIVGGGRPTIVVLAVVPLVVLASKLLGLYDRDAYLLHKTTLDETPQLLQLAVAFMVFAWLLDNQLSTAWLSKGELLLIAVLLFVLTGVARTMARRVATGVSPPERLLVLGAANEMERVREKAACVGAVNADVVGRVPLAFERPSERGPDVLGTPPDLGYVLRKQRIDRVVVCPPGEISSETLDVIRLVKALGVKVSVMPRLLEVVGSSVAFDELGGLTLLGLRRNDLTRSSAFLKRTADLVGAGVALVVLAPVLVVVAVAIKLTSPGPVFFRQRRVGRGGAVFQMLKFRTMLDGADKSKHELLDRNEADGFFKMSDDPRITPVGRFLRRTSLDEMPQLINVVRGDMSLVGPRPLVEEEDKQIEGWFRRRLDITPGMTGAWQVLGSSRIPMRDMVTIDYLYRTNWSLWLDVKILLRTLPHMVGRRGL